MIIVGGQADIIQLCFVRMGEVKDSWSYHNIMNTWFDKSIAIFTFYFA